jgi:polysaccharide export outer membrane protein
MRATYQAGAIAVVLSVLAGGAQVLAQRTAAAAPRTAPASAARPVTPAPAPVGVQVPDDYVIGPEDLLVIGFWRDETISGDAIVRPDGKITLRLINDIQAAGLTTSQLRLNLEQAASKFLTDPTATVAVKAINSRKVHVIGEVGKVGAYPINAPMSVMQLLSIAGGVTEYAKKDKIQILRDVNGKTQSLKFNYQQVLEGKKLEQNILLKPGDTVTVP